MEFKGTKGEWLQLEDDDGGLSTMVIGDAHKSHSPIICDTSIGKTHLTKEEKVLNAKLIAAAPDLLRELEDCVMMLEGLHVQESALEAAKKAITKALK